LTADAIARDLHQDQRETLFSKIEDVQSSVLLMKANEKVWQETMESDWESRGGTSHVMHHITLDKTTNAHLYFNKKIIASKSS
jgi:hypothetical protein